ncbi:MAG: alpha/beta fold hydrolase [Puniceicoccales bacterium]|jgi:haloalkane dehalogenase|nr:alpha/beta fold hydrolase [Puniceicoccales bacterium]
MKTLPQNLREIYPFKNHFLDVGNGNRIHYVDEGEGDAVVMFHGNPTWSFYYRHLIRELRSTFRCIAIDHMGCGLSDKPQNYPYQLANHIANARKVIEYLKLGHFHFVMHDWGCPVAMAIAERWPERIESLTIMNGAAFHSPHVPFRIALCKLPIIGDLLIRGLNAFVLGANFMATSKSLNSITAKGYAFPYNSWKNRVALKKFVADIPLNSQHPSWETLKQIEDGLFLLSQKKILILWGDRDFCFTDRFLQEWKNFFSGAHVVRFENAGHYVLEDARDEAIAAVRGFMVRAKKPDVLLYP